MTDVRTGGERTTPSRSLFRHSPFKKHFLLTIRVCGLLSARGDRAVRPDTASLRKFADYVAAEILVLSSFAISKRDPSVPYRESRFLARPRKIPPRTRSPRDRRLRTGKEGGEETIARDIR